MIYSFAERYKSILSFCVLLFSGIFFLSCEKEQETELEHQPIMTLNSGKIVEQGDAELIQGTSTVLRKIKIENDKYDLVITKNSDYRGRIPSNFEIDLIKGNDTVLVSFVDYYCLHDSIREKYSDFIINEVNYEFVRSNRIYFNATFADSQVKNKITADFAIFYRTKKKGQVDFWNIKPDTSLFRMIK
jgi:hypothetical protein